MSYSTPSRNQRNERLLAPLVLIVDDEDQTPFTELLNDCGVDAIYLPPEEVERETLSQATTVVVDQYLDNWLGRDAQALPLAMQVPDGLSLASVFRSHVEGSGGRSGPPDSAVSFVLRTGEVDKIGAGLPASAREHLLAAQYNLEWVFDKSSLSGQGFPSAAIRIAELARATAELPRDWSAGTGDPGISWLRLPLEARWAEDARWQIEQCRPPQHTVAQRTAGRSWLRWFLHRILPFPTFLIDLKKLALMFGLTTSAMEQVLSSSSALSAMLEDASYGGPLNSFMGPRWWRAGISSLIEQLLEERGMDDEADLTAIAAAAVDAHGDTLEVLEIERPVLELNADYSVLPAPISAYDAVRLQPDDWPPYADEAWADRRRFVGDNSELYALVVSADRWRLHTSPPEK
ncbi:hypothetical protein ACFWDN_08145 [Micromonospora chalcea]